jgi:hypothetical protein
MFPQVLLLFVTVIICGFVAVRISLRHVDTVSLALILALVSKRRVGKCSSLLQNLNQKVILN